MRRGWIWGGLLDPPDYMHFGKVTLGEEANPLATARLGKSIATRAQLKSPVDGTHLPALSTDRLGSAAGIRAS